MEIKTCEQYVLSLLEENQNEVARLQQVVADKELAHQEALARLNDVMKSFQELKDLILKRSVLKRYSIDNDPYISFDNIWQSYNADDFNLITTIIPELLVEDSQE